MAIGLIFNNPGVTQEQYDAVVAQLNLAEDPPAGDIFHAAGPTEDDWRVVEVWESQEAADAFFRERLGQALQNAGIPQPQIERWSVHNVSFAPGVS